jgi:SAM-dependent methyltransferase
MSQYDKDYYENGVQLGISGYSQYRWLPQLTLPLCQKLVTHLSIKSDDKVCDYGCAKGYLVKGLRELQVSAYGVDISKYAIANADADIKEFITLLDDTKGLVDYRKQICADKKFDWIISKDVLEHVPYEQIENVLDDISQNCYHAFIIVPLGSNGKFVIPEYEQDITHIIREDVCWWVEKVLLNGFYLVDAKYRVPGIKDNWAHYEEGNLFLTLKSLWNS